MQRWTPRRCVYIGRGETQPEGHMGMTGSVGGTKVGDKADHVTRRLDCIV